ncbi:MAG TPA: molybdopterin cofactor-binding domain-containing protein, partial [Saliniramus sp.]|nr:molybdopterin cofactor-binding domain-containing protein [Saliniramus sp.]
MDEAAARLKIDRLSLRGRNLVPAGAFPYKTPAGAVYDSGDYLGLLEAASRAADWKGFPKRRRASSKQGRLRGIGASLFVEVAGGGPVPHDEVSLRIDLEDNRPILVIETVSKNTGQGHAESYRKIVAERLGIEPSSIRLDESPPDARLVGAGSFASRSMAAIGEALNDACDKLALALRDVVAGRQGEYGAVLNVVGDAVLRADGSTVAKLRDVLSEAARATPAPVVIGKVDDSITFPSGCHIAEVEVDPETGVTGVVSYVA